LNGNLLEIATVGPGYEIDEKPEELGKKLVLPPWLEKYRKEIELKLKEQDEVNKPIFPPKFKNPPEPPERL